MKQIGSETTTLLATLGSGTGTQHGALGSATPEDVRMAGWLSRRSPAEVDQVALSRASQHNVELTTRTEGRYPEGRPSYTVVVGCRVAGDESGRMAALADLSKLATPAPIREIEGWLAELSVMVARRPQEEIDEALRLSAYSGRLQAYPADVARAALLDHRWKFWPTWEELAGVCDALSSPRRHMVSALSFPIEPREERRAPPSPDERAKVAEIGERYLAEKRIEERERQAKKRKPHWSETALPDDPHWAALRKARAEASRA
jgi:hypothetical protein